MTNSVAGAFRSPRSSTSAMSPSDLAPRRSSRHRGDHGDRAPAGFRSLRQPLQPRANTRRCWPPPTTPISSASTREARRRFRDPARSRGPLRQSLSQRIAVVEPGEGVGVAFMTRLANWAFRETSAHRFWLSTFDNNARAQRAYEKLGFTPRWRVARGLSRHGRATARSDDDGVASAGMGGPDRGRAAGPRRGRRRSPSR